MAEKIAVIGAGVGGLAAAARLAYKGKRVNVYEKLACCGGRNNILEDKGFKFDMGPSFILMPDFFEEVFSYCGQDLKDYLEFKALDINYRIFYPDGEIFTVYKDIERTKIELERLEKGSSAGYGSFIKETERIYKKVRPLLYNCFTKTSIFDPRLWGLLSQLRIFQSYWQLAGKFFKTEKLRFAFTFEAMFMGVSPYDAPAFYSIITYADQVQKIYHPMGGMYQVPLALQRLAKKFGAEFYYQHEVKGLKEQSGRIILQVNGIEAEFDAAVANADLPYFQSEILKRRLPEFRYSCSVFLMYLGLKCKVNGLEHHNLFFSSGLDKNLEQIFESGLPPEEPSFYVHVPTVTDPSLAAQGKDIAYILVPVPNLKVAKENFSDYAEKIRECVFGRIKEQCGIDIEGLIEVEHRFYPEDFISRYNIKFGATFGLSHNLLQSALLRPPNFDKKIKKLFFVGASTQPGGGLPVVIASSRIAADLIERG